MKKTFFRIFTITDWVEEEAWLREQNKKGLKLKKTIAPGFFIFEECEPEDVIYRLEFKNQKATTDYMEMYKDYGWEYFTSCVGWNYFRKPAAETLAENEGELFSDNESKLEMVEKIIRFRMMPLVVIFCCCIIPNITRLLDSHRTGDIILLSIFFVLFFLYCWLFIHCGRKLKKMKRELVQ